MKYKDKIKTIAMTILMQNISVTNSLITFSEK